MRTVLCSFAWLVAMGAVSSSAQPPEGSQLSAEKNNCFTCHSEEDLWKDETLRLYVSREDVEHDAHFRAGVNCHDCHGGDPTSFDVPVAHSKAGGKQEPGPRPFVFPLGDVFESCVRCHPEPWEALQSGRHAQVSEAAEGASEVMRRCGGCHGDKAHGILPVDDENSPVFGHNQVDRCGKCHTEVVEYRNSVHGQGLVKSGLLVTAVCADCHGAHAVHKAKNPKSTLHVTNVANTCGKCHRFIAERLEKSVHGRGNGPGGMADRAAPGGDERQHPTCTSCHKKHDIDPESSGFRLQLPHRCGNCHEELSSRYAMSMHGQLTELGYGPAAKCSDCHGDHDIVPINDPSSPLAPGNRLDTCRKCHPYAVENFCDFDAHADHTDWEANPTLHLVYVGMEVLLYSVFSFFGLHAVLWFVRSLVHTRKHGRPQRLGARQRAYVRFEPLHRTIHAIVIVSFLGLALTGLPLKYYDQAWAKGLAYAMGGFDSTSVWHRICALTTFFYFAAHLSWLANRVFLQRRERVPWKTILVGPDSPVPNVRDAKDLTRMGRWFAGLGPKPVFERWTYWEKFDYWAVFWGVAIIGSTGLALWFPNLFSRFLPGEALNIAKVIHSEEALLATGFIFAIHFFNTHLRPEKFPMDLSMLTGLVTDGELREERPEHLERMRQQCLGQTSSAGPGDEHPEGVEQIDEEQRLYQVRDTSPSQGVLWAVIWAGFVALGIGLCLLAGMILAGLGG